MPHCCYLTNIPSLHKKQYMAALMEMSHEGGIMLMMDGFEGQHCMELMRRARSQDSIFLWLASCEVYGILCGDNYGCSVSLFLVYQQFRLKNTFNKGKWTFPSQPTLVLAQSLVLWIFYRIFGQFCCCLWICLKHEFCFVIGGDLQPYHREGAR